jgi:cytochrome c-type biogenesis protein CcmH/NrfG
MSIPPSFEADDPEAWHVLGIALEAAGNRAGAFTALRNAALLDGSRANTQLALGNLFFETGRFDDALRCFESAAARETLRARGNT